MRATTGSGASFNASEAPDFMRVRVGIGSPPAEFRGDVSGWVLSNFDAVERAELPGVVDIVRKALEDVLAAGFERAVAALHAEGSAKRPEESPDRSRTGGGDRQKSKKVM